MAADGTLGRVRRDLLDADPVEIVAKLTMVYLILMMSGSWYTRLPLILLCSLGLVTSLSRSPVVWLGIVLSLGLRVLTSWNRIDNHDYLISYWALAICLAVATRQPRALAFNGRLLIGLCFAFAVLWKGVLSDSYVDGRFFHVTFLRDQRFVRLGSLAGGMEEEFFRENAKRVKDQARSQAAPEPLQLHSTPQLATLAHITTWFTLWIEALIALVFLWPGSAIARVRDAILLIFAWGTYAIAPVPGFGALLMMMGFAQAEYRLSRALFLGTTFLVYVYEYVPW